MSNFRSLWNLNSGEEKQEVVRKDIQKNVVFRGANLWILACAILIASIGLNVNSAAVIIGAMLISPLMGPIVGVGFALATFDFDLLKKSAKNILIATVVSLLVSFLYFYLSPFKDIQSELLARTSPTIYDVLIAFIGGVVGAISITRVEKGNPIPGVAIATALMPPLCTAGFGLATGNYSFFFGAFYLFSINCFFIGFATFVIIKFLKYVPKNSGSESFNKRLRYIISTLGIIIILPSLYIAYNLFQEKKFTQSVDEFLNQEFTNKGYTIIYKKTNYNVKPKTVEIACLSEKFDSLEVKQFNDELENFGVKNTKLVIRQNSSDLKAEILSEINKNSTVLSEKDLKINQLTSELANYKFSDKHLVDEIEVLFPEIDAVYLGKLSDYSSKDSVQIATTIVYHSEKNIDEEKFSNWLKTKFGDEKIQILRK